MATMVVDPRALSAAPSARTVSRDRLRYLWFGGGAISWLFAVGGRWDLPLAAWLFSVFLLRFSRTSRAGVSVGLVCVASVAAALFWAYELAVPLNTVTTLACVAYGLVFALPFVQDRLLTPRLGALAGLLVYPAAHTMCEFVLGTRSPQGASSRPQLSKVLRQRGATGSGARGTR